MGAYNPKNRDGIYISTCNARVKLGFGEACDSFLAAREIECTSQGHEVWTNAEGSILFSIPPSGASRRFALSVSGFVVTATVAMLFSVW